MSSGALPRLAVAIPLAAIVGLLVGSFLNVVIYRTPLGLSVATPRSFCPTCDRTLAWWENIPVGSWVVLGGRCRTCRHPISIRYPLVELATGIAFALVTWAWDGTIISAGYCALAATIIAVGLIEYDGQRAPLSVAAIGTALGQIIIVAGGSWLHLWRLVGGSLAGVALATVVFGLLRRCDPDCLDPRGHGRSALLVAGCWAGGLGLVPAAVGATVCCNGLYRRLLPLHGWRIDDHPPPDRIGRPEPSVDVCDPPPPRHTVGDFPHAGNAGVPHCGGVKNLRWSHEHRRTSRF